VQVAGSDPAAPTSKIKDLAAVFGPGYFPKTRSGKRRGNLILIDGPPQIMPQIIMTPHRFPPPWSVDHSPSTRRRCLSTV